MTSGPLGVMKSAAEQFGITDDFGVKYRVALHEARNAVAELIEAVAAVYGEPCVDEGQAADDPCEPGCMSCRIRAALRPFAQEGE